MDLNGIVIGFVIGVFLASIKDIGKETADWVFKMLIYYLKQILIKNGFYVGDFPIDVGRVFEATIEPVDSEWSIRISSHVDRYIGMCRVLLNKEELPWANKNGHKVIAIQPHSNKNVRVPKEVSTKDARVQI